MKLNSTKTCLMHHPNTCQPNRGKAACQITQILWRFLMRPFFIYFLLAGFIFAGANFLFAQNEQAQVRISAVDANTFRLSVVCGNESETHSTFLADTNAGISTGQTISNGDWTGVRTVNGELLFNPKSGEWTLKNSAGKELIPQHSIGLLTETTNEIQIELGWNAQNPIAVYGCGNGANSLLQSDVTTGVGNGRAVIPYYWSPAGYAVLAVTANDNQPARWRGATNGEYLTWTFPGREQELYLMPAASLKDAAKAFAHLTGLAPVPPLWAFGYLQSRWGWTDRAYIEDTLKHFLDLKLPVDAF